MTNLGASDTTEHSNASNTQKKAYSYTPPVKLLHGIFTEEFIPYQILLNQKNKNVFYQIVIDHMLFNNSTKAVNSLIRETGIQIPENKIFYTHYNKIVKMLEESTNYHELLDFIESNFELQNEQKTVIRNTLILFLFLKKLKEEGGQKTFNYFKEMRKNIKFDLNIEIFSLVGYTEIQTDFYKNMVCDEKIKKFIHKIKTILWNEKFKRRESMVVIAVDDYRRKRRN